MAAGNLVKILVVDQNGKNCDTSFFVDSTIHDPADTGISAITSALDFLIVGGIEADMVELEDEVQVAGTATPGGYGAADKIHMVCRSSFDGSTHIIDIPNPGVSDSTLAVIFNPDGSVNQSCPAIAAAIAFINAHAMDGAGNLLVWVSGHRTRSSHLKTAF